MPFPGDRPLTAAAIAAALGDELQAALGALGESPVEQIWASPRDPTQARRILEREAVALRRCEDALRGDFARFHEAVAHLPWDRDA